MKNSYPVITLCGSTRFKDEFMKVQKELTLKGCIVITVGLFEHSGDNEAWEDKPEDTYTNTKLLIDDLHLRKIDMSDCIYVINKGGYIGESTRKEIEYAIKHNKKVLYLEPTHTIWIQVVLIYQLKRQCQVFYYDSLVLKKRTSICHLCRY